MKNCGKCGLPRAMYEVCDGCTDKIEAQFIEAEAYIIELKNQLRPFAALLGEHMCHERDNKPVFAVNDNMITVGDLRKSCILLLKN